MDSENAGSNDPNIGFSHPMAWIRNWNGVDTVFAGMQMTVRHDGAVGWLL